MSDRAALVAGLLDDLAAESADLDARVAGLDDAGWATPTPAEGWDVRDTVSHLAVTDRHALLAATDPEGFSALLQEVTAEGAGFVDRLVADERGTPPREVLRGWRAGRAELAAAVRGLDPRARIGWFGPPMSPASFVTARLMETWAHGQDVVDALGQERPPSERLRSVADLGVRTRGFSYALRGRDAPPAPVRVELGGVGGGSWGPEDAADVVRGPALDFCLLVTQRRARSDLALEVVGPAAAEWLGIAQAFAGAPGPGRAPRGA